MEPVILSDITTSTTLLGYGTVGGRHKKSLTILTIILGGFFVFMLLSWWGLGASFLIPSTTNILIVTTPKTAQQLVNRQRLSAFPPVWRSVLENDSRVPVVLGAYLDQGRWGHFAVIPRWQKSDKFFPINQRFFTIIKDRSFPQEEKKIRYREAFGWWTVHPFSDYVVWNDLHFLMPDIKPFFAWGRRNVLSTSLPLSPPISPLSPTLDDINLLLPQKNSAPELLEILFRSIRLGDWSLAHLGLRPLQINLTFDQNLKPAQTSLIFSAPLDDQKIKEILASLGIIKRKAIQLADGTIVVEQRLPENPSALQGKILETPDHQAVSVQKNEVRVGVSPLLDHKPPAPKTCPKKTALWGRFSGKLVTVLLKNFAIPLNQAPAFQIGSYKKKMVVCFEID
ncbi:MAG: hypothetical protein Q8R07_02720, partial [Candidatus Uhrbacteria bacterium]|nr:hypothetical protein [Candidatus Uhrbacteria bacterium]